MTAMGQAQEIRFAIAMIPTTITRITAIGVAQARMLVWSELAPVRKGEVCARARSGTARTSRTRNVCITTPRIETRLI